MPRDAQQIEDTRAWLTKAALDLRAGEGDLTLEPPIPEDAMFHAQQAAEKVLKAFLAWYDEPFRKTHDLRELGRQCVRIDQRSIPPARKLRRLLPLPGSFAIRKSRQRRASKRQRRPSRSLVKSTRLSLAACPRRCDHESIRILWPCGRVWHWTSHIYCVIPTSYSFLNPRRSLSPLQTNHLTHHRWEAVSV